MFGDCECKFCTESVGGCSSNEDDLVFDRGRKVRGDLVAVSEGGVERHFFFGMILAESANNLSIFVRSEYQD